MQKVRELLAKGALDECHQLLTEFIDARTADGGAEGGAELSDAFNTRGHIRYLWVDFDEAIRDYTAAIQLDPGSSVAHYNRGQVHYRLGRYKLAERDLRRAVELDPNFTDAQLNLDQVQKDLDRGHSFNAADQFKEDS